MKIFISWTARDLPLAEALSDTLGQSGHDVVLSDRQPTGTDVMTTIRSADAVVAIVTNDPASYFELGFSLGTMRTVLVACGGGTALPASIANVPYVRLSGNATQDAWTIATRLQILRENIRPQLSLQEPYSTETVGRAVKDDATVIERISGTQFERIVAALFQEKGFLVESREEPDAGFDLMMTTKNDQERCIVVEVKRLSGKELVSVDAVGRLIASLASHNASVGIFVSSAGFTSAARQLASLHSVRLLTLQELLAAKSTRDVLTTESDGHVSN